MRRIFSELVPLAELARMDALMRELAHRRVQLLIAIQPGQESAARDAIASAREAGASVGAWPLLHDADGRWLSRRNKARFERHARTLADSFDVDAIVIDVEPPIADLRRVLRGDPFALVRSMRAQDDRAVAALVGALAPREVIVAVPPPVIDEGRAALGWDRALGIADLDPGAATICTMIYTSLLEGYSRGLLDRRDCGALLDRWSRAAHRRYGARACVGLGCVGKGALGDERTYRGLHELAEDCAIAEGAGVEDLALFDLSGVLASGAPWLAALCDSGEPVSTLQTARARVVRMAVRAAGLALGLNR